MALQRDPSGAPRLIGDNTSEYADLRSRSAGNSSGGVLLLGGDDTIDGSTNNDLIFGNEGEDIIRGNVGNDSLFGGKGKDAILAGEGNDSINGGQDGDVVFGESGNDVLVGGKGNDFLLSGNGNDTLVGGVGRDILLSGQENGSFKIGGTNLFVLQAEAGVTDINNVDLILNFRQTFDKIGLSDGLTVNDIVLENLTNVPLTVQFEFPQAAGSFLRADQLRPISALSSGTLIKIRNSGDLIGFVEGITPALLQNSILNSIVSVQGF